MWIVDLIIDVLSLILLVWIAQSVANIAENVESIDMKEEDGETHNYPPDSN